MKKETRISVWNMRAMLRSIRNRVLAGETFLCLYWGQVKAELSKIEPNTDMSVYSKHHRIKMDAFKIRLTECWRAIEDDPTHPGFVVCFYGKPWGLFKRFDRDMEEMEE